MNPLVTITMVLLASSLSAQVNVGTYIRLIGDEGERRIDGLAPATSPTSAITVEASLLGTPHWATASVNGQTILLEQAVAPTSTPLGCLLRFLVPADLDGNILIDHGDDLNVPIKRPDGLSPVRGQMRAGVLAEVIRAFDHWVLTSPAEPGCPAGSAWVRPGLCMDVASASPALAMAAVEQCHERNGKLCTWDEYIVGCRELGELLENMFMDWEWLDDTSNHTHTYDQAGRTTCMSQRSINPVVTQGRVRCCYRIK